MDNNAVCREVRRVTLAGMVWGIVLTLFKFVVGFIGHSQAVVADAFHSLSDISTDIAILLGSKFWSAPADKDHPYGHGRIETFVTSFIGIMLIAAGAGIGWSSLIALRDKGGPQPGWIAFTGAAASVIVKELLYRWTLKKGKALNSSAMRANAWHHRTDALSSIPVAVAVVVAVINPRWSFVDHVGAFVVSVFILYAAWKIIKPSLMELTEGGVPDDIRQEILQRAGGAAGVSNVHALRTRTLGSSVFADLHIHVDGEISVTDGHLIAEKVKRILTDEMPDVADVVVHVEPEQHHSD